MERRTDLFGVTVLIFMAQAINYSDSKSVLTLIAFPDAILIAVAVAVDSEKRRIVQIP